MRYAAAPRLFLPLFLTLSLSAPVHPAYAHQTAAAPPAAVQGTDAASQATAGWLALVDAGRYADSWTQAAAAFRGALAQAQWEQAMRSVRAPLGAVTSRSLASSQPARSLPGLPAGDYVVLQYRTDFEKRQGSTESVTMVREPDGSLRVLGYFIQ